MSGRLIVVSNRIPTDAAPSGGLVVALHDALKDRGGLWIGHSGKVGDDLSQGLTQIADEPYRRCAFDLSTAEHRGFYLNYANATLWPLFHHRVDLMTLDPDSALVYRQVNQRIAALVAAEMEPDDVLWVHDYHFLPLAHALRELGARSRIGFFLHIPFPSADDVPALPEQRFLIDWLAAYDLVGLQTQRDVGAAMNVLLRAGAEMLLDGEMRAGDRRFRLASFPIGIDVDAFVKAAADAPPAGATLRLDDGEKLVLGVDRLDYSKGIPNRFAAFGHFLESGRDGDTRATLLQIAPPSREDVEAYKDIREELETLSGRVNGEHAELDWTPIRYIRRGLPREVLAALYRRANVMLVTPLADGMNLVAKEYVAAQDEANPGVLILSHFAGAAEQLHRALMVNPYDLSEVARAIREALEMPLDERIERHKSLLATIRETDIDWWTASYLETLAGRADSAAA